MGVPLHVQLTTRFYTWEHRGRGWHTFDEPVDIEPPFCPFHGHYVSAAPVEDDTHRPFLSWLFGGNKKSNSVQEIPEEFPPVEPYLFDNNDALWIGKLLLPKEQKIEIKEIEQLLLMLSYSNFPISFEIIGTDTTTAIQFVCRYPDAAQIRSQVQAYFPSITIEENSDDSTRYLLEEAQPYSIQHYALQDEFMRPIAMTEKLDPDPLIGLFAVLEQLQRGQRAILQILFKGALNPWAESIMRAVTDNNGGSFFEDDPQMVKLAEKKVASPLFAVCIRSIVQGNTEGEVDIMHDKFASAILKLSSSTSNQFIPIAHEIPPLIKVKQANLEDSIVLDTYLAEIQLRRSHRLGMILNAKELATFVHFPNQGVTASKFERETKRTKATPQSVHGHSFVLGKNIHQGHEQIVTLPTSMRLRHMHLIGATGTGKSTFLQNLIIEDCTHGKGLCVVDPHGDLIETILTHIPERRYDDVVLIDPADAEYPIGFNILSAHTDIEKEILSSDLVAVFRRLSTSWGDQMNSVLANAILAFLESTKGGTLIDLRRFLLETDYRREFLKTVADPNVLYYWQHSYPLLKSSSIGSILTRLDAFLRPKILRNMVGQRKGLDFEQLMDSNKIILVKLPQGLIGAENSYLLGTLIVSKIYQAAMARQAKAKADRKEFYLYIDEFHNFITPSIAAILAGARKYALGLVIAHQEMTQLQKQDAELASAIIANPGVRVCFRLGDTDAKKFEEGFSYFTADDLRNLHIGEAIVRVERPDHDFSLTIDPLPEPKESVAANRTQSIIAASREKYAMARTAIESELASVLAPLPQAEIPKQHIPVKPVQQQAPAPVIPVEPIQPSKIPNTQTKELSEHRYLQTLIKRMAEARGYKVAIEEPILQGKGRVDISMERKEKKIACEISISTTAKWEVHNIEKCVEAGYTSIVVCSQTAKQVQKIQDELKASSLNGNTAIHVFTPDELFTFLDKELISEITTGKVVKGYKVNTEFNPITDEEMKRKQSQIIRTITEQKRKND